MHFCTACHVQETNPSWLEELHGQLFDTALSEQVQDTIIFDRHRQCYVEKDKLDQTVNVLF